MGAPEGPPGRRIKQARRRCRAAPRAVDMKPRGPRRAPLGVAPFRPRARTRTRSAGRSGGSVDRGAFLAPGLAPAEGPGPCRAVPHRPEPIGTARGPNRGPRAGPRPDPTRPRARPARGTGTAEDRRKGRQRRAGLGRPRGQAPSPAPPGNTNGPGGSLPGAASSATARAAARHAVGSTRNLSSGGRVAVDLPNRQRFARRPGRRAIVVRDRR